MEERPQDLVSNPSSWDDLPESLTDFVPTEEGLEESKDETSLIHPPANACPTCGLEIVREPGTRGRTPKYHPECRPSKKTASSSGSSVKVAPVRLSKDDQERIAQTELILDKMNSALDKAVLILSFVDPFDAFVVHLNRNDIVDNLRFVCLKYDSFRRWFNVAGGVGSIGGLVLALASTILPILAHHKLIPVKRVAQFLTNLPLVMYRMQQLSAMNDGDVGETLMARMRDKFATQQEAQMRRATAEAMPDADATET